MSGDCKQQPTKSRQWKTSSGEDGFKMSTGDPDTAANDESCARH